MYEQMGSRDLVASDPADYIRLALELGTSLAANRTARSSILERCSILYDDKQIIREMENAWERILAAH